LLTHSPCVLHRSASRHPIMVASVMRLTLIELLRRMRKGGYLSAHGIEAGDQFEMFEKLIDEVAGSGALKFYYIVDRREFMDKVKSVYAAYA
jgi:hypothetical protein